MIIKGHILQLFSDSGKRYFLSQENVLLKDYGDYAEKVTKSIKANIEEMTSETTIWSQNQTSHERKQYQDV